MIVGKKIPFFSDSPALRPRDVLILVLTSVILGTALKRGESLKKGIFFPTIIIGEPGVTHNTLNRITVV